jgi:hypothetical protein
VSAEEWERLRVPTWKHWLALVSEAPNDEHLRQRAIYTTRLSSGDEPGHEQERRCAPPAASRFEALVEAD